MTCANRVGGEGESLALADFCCPNCRSALSLVEPQQLACQQCSRSYARLGGVWCLVSEPGFWRALWLSRLEDFGRQAGQEIAQLASAAQSDGLSGITRRRLARMRSGLEAQLSSISDHLRALDNGGSGAGGSVPAPHLPGRLPVVKCYENLFRDWSWGADEAEQSLRLVERLVSRDLGKLVVHGAGAARLAVDVHTRLAPSSTVALDLNPFPLLVASRLIRGEQLTLPEFPLGPHSERDVVVSQVLRCASEVGPHFSLAFADLLCPPFAAGSIDTVLTSWVIDALDADLRETVGAIGHVLRLGGTWINIGPLRFDRNLSGAYSIEEVHEMATEAGFELASSFHDSIDYFNSPHSGSRRRETVFCFAARRICGAGPSGSLSGVYPKWLLDPNEPIPLTQNTVALRRSSVFTHGVLSLVDGKRTLRDVAERLGTNWQVPPNTLLEPLRMFFARFPFE